mgnify:FL=1
MSEAKLTSLSGGASSSSVWCSSDKKFRRESVARLNEFAKELRTFREIDMSGMHSHACSIIFLKNITEKGMSLFI